MAASGHDQPLKGILGRLAAISMLIRRFPATLRHSAPELGRLKGSIRPQCFIADRLCSARQICRVALMTSAAQ